MVNTSRPDKRQAISRGSTLRGVILATVSAMPLMCSGVVPQQPPMIFKNPDEAHSPT